MKFCSSDNHYIFSQSHLPNKCFFISFNEGSLEMTKNPFYFMSKTLLVLKIVLIFWAYRKTSWSERSGQFQNALRWKLVNQRLQFLQLLPTTWRSKNIRAIKFGRLKWGKETNFRLFLFFKKLYIMVKASGMQLSFNKFWWFPNLV